MSIVVNLKTVPSGVRAMVRLGLMAEVGKLAIAQLLKMRVTQVPVLLSDEAATLPDVVVDSRVEQQPAYAVVTAVKILSASITACWPGTSGKWHVSGKEPDSQHILSRLFRPAYEYCTRITAKYIKDREEYVCICIMAQAQQLSPVFS